MSKVKIIAIDNPIGRDPVLCHVDAGQTVGELFPDLSSQVEVTVNGRAVAENEYSDCVLLSDDVVTMVRMPAGSREEGKNIARSAALLAVAIAGSVVSGGALAPVLGSSFASGTFGAALAGAAVATGGSLLVNTVIPPPALSQSSNETSPFSRRGALTGSQNRLEQYAPVPRVYGHHRMYAPMSAKYYTEIVGNQQYLRLLLCYGPGPLEFSAPKIGDTLIGSFDSNNDFTSNDVFEDVEIDVAENPSLYSTDVNQEAVNEPFEAFGDSAIRTTIQDADEASIDLTFPTGLFGVTYEKEEVIAANVKFVIEYREVGDTEWLSVNGYKTEQECNFNRLPQRNIRIDDAFDCTEVETDDPVPYKISNDAKETYRVGISFDFPQPGQYEIRVTRKTRQSEATITSDTEPVTRENGQPLQTGDYWIDSNDNNTEYRYISEADADSVPAGWYENDGDLQFKLPTILDRAVWTAFRSIKNEAPTNLPGHVQMAIRIKATDQLNGILDTFSVEVKSRLPYYDGSDWDIPTFNPNTGSGSGGIVTSSPAWIFADVLTSEHNPQAIDRDRIDGDVFKYWDDNYGDEFEYNAVLDNVSTVRQLLGNIAAAGKASWGIPDGKYRPIFDEAGQTPTDMYTDRNTSDFKASKIFPKELHGLKLKYADRDKDWKINERIVYADGYSEDGQEFEGGTGACAIGASGQCKIATKFEEITLDGVTSADQAWKMGRFKLAERILRPEVYQRTVGVNNLRSQRGDLILSASDTVLHGGGTGRIKGFTEQNGDVVSIEVDDVISMEAGETYYLHVRYEDGTIDNFQIQTQEGSFNTVDLQTSQPLDISVGDLYTFGQPAPLKIINIQPGYDFTATLTMVDAADAIHDSDQGTIPDFDPQITEPVEFERTQPPTPSIDSVRSDQNSLYKDADGTVRLRMLVSFTVGNGNPTTEIEARYRAVNSKDGWIGLVKDDANLGVIALPDVTQGKEYIIQIRARYKNNVSGWVQYATEHAVEGKVQNPPDVTGFTATIDKTQIRLNWNPVDETDNEQYEVRKGVSWEDGTFVDRSKRTKMTDDITGSGNVTYWIKAIDTSGNYSENAPSSSVTIDEKYTDDPIYREEFDNAISANQDSLTALQNKLGDLDQYSGTLVEELNGLWANLSDLDTILGNPSSAENFFSSIATNQAWVDEFVANTGYIDQLTAQVGFFETLVGDEGFFQEFTTNSFWAQQATFDNAFADLITSNKVITPELLVGRINAGDNTLQIAGQHIEITGETIFASGYDPSTKAESEDLNDYVQSTVYNQAISDLQGQIDGQIESYFQGYDPTTNNEPAVNWTTTELKEQHRNDTFTNSETGESWRWVNESGPGWYWKPIAETATQQALAKALEAQDTADGKRRVFVSQPTPPYDIGDLWSQGSNGDLLRSTVNKVQGDNYNANDWVPATKYTDDSRAIEAENNAKQGLYESLGFNSYQDLLDNALSETLFVNGGYLRGTLFEADAIKADAIDVDDLYAQTAVFSGSLSIGELQRVMLNPDPTISGADLVSGSSNTYADQTLISNGVEQSGGGWISSSAGFTAGDDGLLVFSLDVSISRNSDSDTGVSIGYSIYEDQGGTYQKVSDDVYSFDEFDFGVGQLSASRSLNIKYSASQGVKYRVGVQVISSQVNIDDLVVTPSRSEYLPKLYVTDRDIIIAKTDTEFASLAALSGGGSGSINAVSTWNKITDKPFNSVSSDFTVSSGVLNIDGYNPSNWNTAYGWGNHASVGYYKSGDNVALNSGVFGSETTVNQLGVTFNRSASYLRPSSNDSKTLYVGGFSQGDYDWQNIVFRCAGVFKYNDNDIYHTGNLTDNSQLSNTAGYYSSGDTVSFAGGSIGGIGTYGSSSQRGLELQDYGGASPRGRMYYQDGAFRLYEQDSGSTSNVGLKVYDGGFRDVWHEGNLSDPVRLSVNNVFTGTNEFQGATSFLNDVRIEDSFAQLIVNDTDTANDNLTIIASGDDIYLRPNQNASRDLWYNGLRWAFSSELRLSDNLDATSAQFSGVVTFQNRINFPNDQYLYSAEGQPRLYFISSSSTIYRADRHQFRDAGNNNIAFIDQSGNAVFDGRVESSLYNSDASTGDKISLLENRFNDTDMYGFGVGTGGHLYHKSYNSHQWYRRTNYDDSSWLMKLDDGGLEVADAITTPILRTQLFKFEQTQAVLGRNVITQEGGGVVGTPSTDGSLNGNQIRIDTPSVTSGTDVVISGYTTSGFASVRASVTSVSSDVLTLSMITGSISDIKVGYDVVAATGDMILMDVLGSEPFIAGYDNVPNFANSPVVGNGTPNWIISQEKIEAAGIFKANGRTGTGQLAGFGFNNSVLYSDNNNNIYKGAGIHVDSQNERMSIGSNLFFEYDDNTGKSRIYHDSFTAMVYSKQSEASYSGSDESNNLDDDYKLAVTRNGNGTSDNDRRVITSATYLHRFGLNKILIAGFASRALTGSTTSNNGFSELRFVIDGNTYTETITSPLSQQFTKEIDITGLTPGNKYNLEIYLYARSEVNGGGTFTTETRLREDVTAIAVT